MRLTLLRAKISSADSIFLAEATKALVSSHPQEETEYAEYALHPANDHLFHSAPKMKKLRIAAAILTGMGSD